VAGALRAHEAARVPHLRRRVAVARTRLLDSLLMMETIETNKPI
jgi:hypothetical protein